MFISACKKNDDPVSNDEVTWKGLNLPAAVTQNQNPSFNLYTPSGGGLYLTSYGNLYRSNDNGDSWSQLPFPMTAFPPYADSSSGYLTVAPNGVLFSSNGVNYSNGSGPMGSKFVLYRSLDGGATWQNVAIPGGMNNRMSPPICASNGTVYLALSNTIYSSTDNGTSWTTFVTVTAPVNVAVAPSGTVYIMANNVGIMRTSNNGATWDTVNTGLPTFTPYPQNEPFIVGISPSGTVYAEIYPLDAQGNMAGTGSTFYYSTNSGTTWQVENNGIASSANVQSLYFIGDNKVIANTAMGNFISNDGITWSGYSIDMPANGAHLMGLDGQNYLYAGFFEGIFKTAKPLD
jgi:photosystem II stability/assembly factor-like uncharacterized protein